MEETGGTVVDGLSPYNPVVFRPVVFRPVPRGIPTGAGFRSRSRPRRPACQHIVRALESWMSLGDELLEVRPPPNRCFKR